MSKWEWKKLGEVCEIARGGSPRPIKEYITSDADGINWIKIGDTDPTGKYIFSTEEKIKPSGIKNQDMWKVAIFFCQIR
nr:restriction endonuclease subunit S [Fibrobacter sp. UWT3]